MAGNKAIPAKAMMRLTPPNRCIPKNSSGRAAASLQTYQAIEWQIEISAAAGLGRT
jgi:hypothetical protein